MESGKVGVTIGCKFPWWWKLYIQALKFFSGLGLLAVDADSVSNFIVRHCRFYMIVDGRKKWCK